MLTKSSCVTAHARSCQIFLKQTLFSDSLSQGRGVDWRYTHQRRIYSWSLIKRQFKDVMKSVGLLWQISVHIAQLLPAWPIRAPRRRSSGDRTPGARADSNAFVHSSSHHLIRAKFTPHFLWTAQFLICGSYLSIRHEMRSSPSIIFPGKIIDLCPLNAVIAWAGKSVLYYCCSTQRCVCTEMCK